MRVKNSGLRFVLQHNRSAEAHTIIVEGGDVAELHDDDAKFLLENFPDQFSVPTADDDIAKAKAAADAAAAEAAAAAGGAGALGGAQTADPAAGASGTGSDPGAASTGAGGAQAVDPSAGVGTPAATGKPAKPAK